ncbi:hypothetical protein [Marinomonas alcarazii]|uniref:hypothetical protein n=1 Tax=Marinomonas alcarazii TaxID=491949 RepID=UPI001C64E97E|nr:hypothetical protein [Marinomonas alcarazii]
MLLTLILTQADIDALNAGSDFWHKTFGDGGDALLSSGLLAHYYLPRLAGAIYRYIAYLGNSSKRAHR